MVSHLFLATADPEGAAQRYVELLTKRLQDFDVHVDGRFVHAKIGVFRLAYTTFHPFKGVSSVLFRVIPQRERLLVDYDIRLTGLVWTLFLFSLLTTAYSLSFPWAWLNLVGPPCATAFVIGLNWLYSHLAIRSFLRRIGEEAQASDRRGGRTIG